MKDCIFVYLVRFNVVPFSVLLSGPSLPLGCSWSQDSLELNKPGSLGRRLVNSSNVSPVGTKNGLGSRQTPNLTR